jgi:hypothetical protein
LRNQCNQGERLGAPRRQIGAIAFKQTALGVLTSHDQNSVGAKWVRCARGCAIAAILRVLTGLMARQIAAEQGLDANPSLGSSAGHRGDGGGRGSEGVREPPPQRTCRQAPGAAARGGLASVWRLRARFGSRFGRAEGRRSTIGVSRPGLAGASSSDGRPKSRALGSRRALLINRRPWRSARRRRRLTTIKSAVGVVLPIVKDTSYPRLHNSLATANCAAHCVKWPRPGLVLNTVPVPLGTIVPGDYMPGVVPFRNAELARNLGEKCPAATSAARLDAGAACIRRGD